MGALLDQAALEVAAVELIRAGCNLEKPERMVRRMYDGKPPPNMGKEFVGVWSKNGRQSEGRMSLTEKLGVRVTITIRLELPFDRWVEHRDRMGVLVRSIERILAKDQYKHDVVNRANALAEFTLANAAPFGTTRQVGFVEPLRYAGADDIMEVGEQWLSAVRPEKAGSAPPEIGITQTMNFVEAMLKRNLASI